MTTKQDPLSDQQGFYPSNIQIRHSDPTTQPTLHNNNSFFAQWPFQVKYLPWTGLMKKQPSQALNATLRNTEQEIIINEQINNKMTVRDHPYALYASNQKYRLVYSKFNDNPIKNQQFFLSTSITIEDNLIKLQHVGTKKPIQFKHLKTNPTIQPIPPKSDTLIFNSRFQCANLHCAYRLQKTNQYILFIQNDTNTHGYNQWFYFSIQNNQPHIRYTFKLVNCKKKYSFFQKGLKPTIFSLQEYKVSNTGWKKNGINIIYQQSPIQIDHCKYYCLSFQLMFQYQNDFIMIAMNLPYSYTKLVNFMMEAERQAKNDQLGTLQFSIKSLCRSICGNQIPQLTITRTPSTSTSTQPTKKIIIILARQHPVQTWSSYMIQGMIRHLISKPDQHLHWLLSNHIIKIYPMINVDGVIYGNSRCDITGVDLNRRWKYTSKLMYPQIYEIKRKILGYKTTNKIQCCFDLHAHSKKYNIFAYSCKINDLTCRILPLLISNINSTFDFPSCTFGISKYKQSTARVWLHKILKNQNILTIESSFYATNQNNQLSIFTPQHIYQMGRDILTACTIFLDKKNIQLVKIKKQISIRIQQFNHYDKINQKDQGSDSEPSIDQIDLQTKINTIFNKNIIFADQFIRTQSEKYTNINNNNNNNTNTKSYIYNQLTSTRYKQPNLKTIKQPQTITTSSIKQPRITSNNTNIQISTKDDDLTLPQFNITKPTNKKKYQKLTQQQKSHEISFNHSINNISNQGYKNKEKNISIHLEIESTTQRKTQQKLKINTIQHQPEVHKQELKINQKESRQFHKTAEKIKEGNQFNKKNYKFTPNLMSIKNKVNMTLFEQTLYNQDHSNLLNKLFQNKKKIQQNLKRSLYKSHHHPIQQKPKFKPHPHQQHLPQYKSLKNNQKPNHKIKKLTSQTNINIYQ